MDPVIKRKKYKEEFLVRKIQILLFLFCANFLLASNQQIFWCVQIASSFDLSELKKDAKKITTDDTRIEKIGSLYTLRSGFFPTREEAEKLKSILSEKGIKNTLVRTCYFVKERVIFPESFREAKLTEIGKKESEIKVVYSKSESIPPIANPPTEIPKTTSCRISSQEDRVAETENTPFAEYEKKLEKILMDVHTDILKKGKEDFSDITILDSIFSIPESEPSVTRANLLLKTAKKDAETRNTGLKITGQYTQNENVNIIEDEDAASYKWRAYLGLEWDILHDGFREHQRKKKALEEDLKAENLLLPAQMKYEMYPYFRNAIIYLFNEAKKEKLQRKIDFLAEYVKILRKLYFSSIVSLEDVQNMEKELWRAKNMLEGYTGYEKNLPVAMRKELEKFNADLLPVVGINIDKICKTIADPKLRNEILSHQKTSLAQQYKFDYNVRLAPFIRYYFGDTQTRSNDYFALGVSLSVPLPVSEHKTKEVQQIEKDYLESAYDRNIRDSLHDVINTYYEYTYKLDDLIKFLFQKETLLEQLRKDLVKFDMKDPLFSVPETMVVYNQYLNTEFEILHIKQLLYLKLAFMTRYIPEFTINPFVFPVEIEKEIKMYAKQREGDKSLYIWSDAFNNVDNNFLLWFLRTKSIKHVLISFGKNTDRKKLDDFIKLAGDSISVEALFGDNSLLINKNKLKDVMEEISSYQFKGLHLDVEPYTFSNWKINTAKYLGLYVEMLKTVNENQWLKDKIFSISIPIFYPEEFLRKIFPLVDKVCVMTYETKNPDTVSKWIKEEVQIDETKVVIALRNKDFESELELEDFISALKEKTGISSFALHSLADYLKTGDLYETEDKTNIH